MGCLRLDIFGLSAAPLRFLASFGLLLAYLAVPNVAHAAGAIAAGVPDDVAENGVAMFVQVNAASIAEARDKAIAGCKTLGSQTARDLCKIVATFSNQCAAESIDPKDGTPGYGWAIADTSAEAKSQAIANCRATAGPARQDACVILDRSLWCDGSAK
jgi:hypothetical protein